MDYESSSQDDVSIEQLQHQKKTSINRLTNLIEHCQNLHAVNGISRLIKRLEAERKHLKNMDETKYVSSKQHFQSSNVNFYEIFVNRLVALPDVISVLEPFSNSSEKIVVDIIYENGYKWMKIISRNPQALHLSCFGYHDKTDKCTLKVAKSHLILAHQNEHNFEVPEIVFNFGRGVTQKLKDALIAMNVKVEGCIVELTELTLKRLTVPEDVSGSDTDEDLTENLTRQLSIKPFDKKRVNLDVSTMIALVSELSHGGYVYDFENLTLRIPAALERAKRILPVLNHFLQGKEKIVCQSAYDEFNEIINTVGGPKELRRGQALLSSVKVVPDQPSDRVMSLQLSSKVRHRTKIIFGTGDTLRVLTTTSNESFLRSAAQQGVKLFTLTHEGRALSEKHQPVPL